MYVNALCHPLGRIVEMNTRALHIRCQSCGALFRVVEAWNGAAVQCPSCNSILAIRLVPTPAQQQAPQSSAEPGLVEVLLKALGFAAVGVVVYKGLQALFDGDFGNGEYPRWFREEMRGEHVAQYGCRCPQCGRRVRYDDLTIDHVVSLKNGGRTSKANADVMCRTCNSQKGGKNTFFDYIRGRSY